MSREASSYCFGELAKDQKLMYLLHIYLKAWLMMATMLQVFNLRPRKDPSGKDIPLEIKWDDALVRYVDSKLHARFLPSYVSAYY